MPVPRAVPGLLLTGVLSLAPVSRATPQGETDSGLLILTPGRFPRTVSVQSSETETTFGRCHLLDASGVAS